MSEITHPEQEMTIGKAKAKEPAGKRKNDAVPEVSSEHFAMAQRIAKKASRGLPDHMREDVLADAYLGLADAREKFDSTKGVPFDAYLPTRIKGSVLDCKRRSDILPRRERKALKEKEALRTEQEARNRASDPSADPSAGLPDAPVRPTAVDADVLGYLASDEASPEEQAIKSEQIRRLREAVRALPERDQTILSLAEEEIPIAEIGKQLGVSESRISQLHRRAVERLKEYLGAVKKTKK